MRHYNPVYYLMKWADESKNELLANNHEMHDLSSHFVEVENLTIKQLLEITIKTEKTINEMCDNLGKISGYCQGVIRWIDDFSDV